MATLPAKKEGGGRGLAGESRQPWGSGQIRSAKNVFFFLLLLPFLPLGASFRLWAGRRGRKWVGGGFLFSSLTFPTYTHNGERGEDFYLMALLIVLNGQERGEGRKEGAVCQKFVFSYSSLDGKQKQMEKEESSVVEDGTGRTLNDSVQIAFVLS